MEKSEKGATRTFSSLQTSSNFDGQQGSLLMRTLLKRSKI